MKHDTILINKITADEGFVLTNGQGVYSKEIYLGKNDSAENWHEITDAEYQEILKEQEEEMAESMPEYEEEIQEDVLEQEVKTPVEIPEREMEASEHILAPDEEL